MINLNLAEWDPKFWLNDKRRCARDEIIERMIKGQTFEAACRMVGIDSSTGRRWKQRCTRFKQETKLAKYLARMTLRVDKLWRESGFVEGRSGEAIRTGS